MLTKAGEVCNAPGKVFIMSSIGYAAIDGLVMKALRVARTIE